MSPVSLIRTAFAVTAAISMIAGCASANVDLGQAASASDQPALDSPASAPARSIPPTGPAATAATGSPPSQAPHATAHVGSVAVACPDGLWPGLASSLPPLAQDVAITAVVRCEPVRRTYSSLGEWGVQLAEVANHGFEGFVAALHEPSQETPPNQACPSIGYLIPWFALVTADGSVVRAAIPTGACGEPHADAIKTLQALPFRVVDAVRVQQIRSPGSIASGCEQQWKDMITLEYARRSSGSNAGGVAGIASLPSSVLVCSYKVIDASVPGGELVEGVTVTGEAAGEIASGVEIANSVPGGCAAADTFAVVHNGPWISYVELGGCNRVLTSDGRLGTASAGLITTLQTALRPS